jgi:homoserine dehydrogenase
MTDIAILGFGKLGQALVDNIQHHPDWQGKYRVRFLWEQDSGRICGCTTAGRGGDR